MALRSRGFSRQSLVSLALAGLLAMGAGVQSAAGAPKSSGRGETQAGPLTTWILLTKPPKGRGGKKNKGYAGIQLFSKGAINVPAGVNPLTGAEGRIASHATGDRNCSCIHYHGTLFGKADPAELKCGWGCVMQFDAAPAGVGHLSNAITFEENAIKKAATDLAEAKANLASAATALNDARNNAPQPGEGHWDLGDARKYDTATQTALDQDAEAAAGLTAAQDEQDPQKKKRKIDKALDNIAEALKAKRQALNLIVKALNLADNGGGD